MSKNFTDILILSAISTLPVIVFTVKGKAITILPYALFVFVLVPLIGIFCVFVNQKWKGKTFTWKLRHYLELLIAFWTPWAVVLITAFFAQR